MAGAAPAARASVAPSCSWQPLALQNGWQSAQPVYGTGDPSYCLGTDGMVYLSGSLTAPGGAASDQFAVLPPSAAPAHRDYLSVYTFAGTLGVLRIDPDGSLHAYNAQAFAGQAAQYTSLAAVSFPAGGTAEQGLALQNGWQSGQPAYGSGDPAYLISGGAAHLDGSALQPGSLESFFTMLPAQALPALPAEAPPAPCDFITNVYTYAGTASAVLIDENGNTGGGLSPSNQFTSLAGVSYPVGQVPWQPLAMLAGSQAAACDPLSYAIVNGVVYLSGTMQFPSQYATPGGFSGEFAVLPAGARPTHVLYLDVAGQGANHNSWVMLRIDPSGAMSVFHGGFGPAGSSTLKFEVWLDGLSYHSLS
jgi:hypothetical protein